MIYYRMQIEGGIPVFFPVLVLFGRLLRLLRRRENRGVNGELEIADVMNAYLAQGTLRVELLGRGFPWLGYRDSAGSGR